MSDSTSEESISNHCFHETVPTSLFCWRNVANGLFSAGGSGLGGPGDIEPSDGLFSDVCGGSSRFDGFDVDVYDGIDSDVCGGSNMFDGFDADVSDCIDDLDGFDTSRGTGDGLDEFGALFGSFDTCCGG